MTRRKHGPEEVTVGGAPEGPIGMTMPRTARAHRASYFLTMLGADLDIIKNPTEEQEHFRDYVDDLHDRVGDGDRSAIRHANHLRKVHERAHERNQANPQA